MPTSSASTRSGGSSAAATRCRAPGTSWASCSRRAAASSGSATSWARPRSRWPKQQGEDPYFLLTDEAALAGPGAEGLFFLPYLTGERTPHFDPDAKGAWIGLTVRHGRPHMIRSLLEGATFAMRDSLELIREMGVDDRAGPRLGRRRPQPALAADPGRHLRLRRAHAQLDRRAGLRRRPAGPGRHRRLRLGPRGVRRHHPRRSIPRASIPKARALLRPGLRGLSPALPRPAAVVQVDQRRWSKAELIGAEAGPGDLAWRGNRRGPSDDEAAGKRRLGATPRRPLPIAPSPRRRRRPRSRPRRRPSGPGARLWTIAGRDRAAGPPLRPGGAEPAPREPDRRRGRAPAGGHHLLAEGDVPALSPQPAAVQAGRRAAGRAGRAR